jgi:CRP-like cAMP-binding protein
MLSELFDILCGESEALNRCDIGSLLFARGDEVKSLFVLEDGEVKLSRSLKSGKELVLHRSKARSIVAEASIYSAIYHCDAICLSLCTVRKLSISQFLILIDENSKLSSAWSAHLARNLQSARYRSEILTMKKVSERLDAWHDWHSSDFPPKGKWKEIAAEIGVSPEALYRELATRKL